MRGVCSTLAFWGNCYITPAFLVVAKQGDKIISGYVTLAF